MTDVITTSDKLSCARRELSIRQRVYPHWQAQNKISAGRAAHEMACMKAIVEDYERAEAKERLL